MINSSFQTAQHVINLIVKQSKQKIQEHKLAKTMCIPYSYAIIENRNNDTLLHTGVNYDKPNAKIFQKQIDLQQKPSNCIKDSYTFFSVKKFHQDKKQNAGVSVQKQDTNKKAIKQFFKAANQKNRLNQVFYKKKKVNAEPKRVELMNEQDENSFIKLEQTKQKTLKFLAHQENQIEQLRRVKYQETHNNEDGKRKEDSQSQLNTQRFQKLSSSLYNHLSKQSNQHTYDIDGGLLLFSSQNNKKAIAKAFPPTIRYDIQSSQNQESLIKLKNRSKGARNRTNSNHQLKRKSAFNSKIQTLKGQIFKSSVLKTINLSRISFGNQQFDSAQFMKRNDLFNNNHSRQTTSIPFMKMQGSSVFKQTATNQRLSNKDIETEADSKKETENSQKIMSENRTKSHENRFRNKFRKYSLKNSAQTCSNSFVQNYPVDKIYPSTTKNVNSIGDSRYSSFYIKRPYTTQVGRIRRQNEILFHSMLDEQ